VDSEGNPLTAYHGTSDEIDKFQLGHPNRKDAGWLGHGIYFTNSRDMAQANADMKAKRVGGTPKVMSVHLNLQNPYYATLGDKARLQKANSSEASQAFTNALKDKGHDGVIWKQNDYHEYVAFHPDQVKILPQDDVEKKAKGGVVLPADHPERQQNLDEFIKGSHLHDNGVPRRYYTGTSKDKDFSSFNVGRHGAWFTTDPEEASQYAKENDSQTSRYENGRFVDVNSASRVIPVYLRAMNPYTGERPKHLNAQNYKKAQSDWFDQLRSMGHDSWVPASQNGKLAVILKDPTQIKSAIGNRGTYNLKEKDITKATGGIVHKDRGGEVCHMEDGGSFVDSVVDTFPSLAPVANMFGFKKSVIDQPELPWNVSSENEAIERQPLYSLPKSTWPQNLPKSIQAYRANQSGQLETQPIHLFNTGRRLVVNKLNSANPDPETSTSNDNSEKAIQELYRYARLNGAAAKYNMPSLTPEEMVAFALKEGRPDIGHSGIRVGNKTEKEFDENIKNTYNISPRDRNFLLTLYAKQQVAKKLNIPFAEAWNGTGTNEVGQTGKQYAQNYQLHLNAASHPKNQQLLDLIKKGIDDGQKHGLPLKSAELEDVMPHRREVPYQKGGSIRMNTGGPVSLDAMRLALLNVPKMANGGDFESDSLLPQGRAQRRMASKMMTGPKPLTIMKETGGQWLNGPFGNVEPKIEQYRQSGDATPEKQAVNNWVNTTLTKYMKRDFGTENDPVRLLHEQGITHHSNPDELNEKGQRDHFNWITGVRKSHGMPETAISKSDLAKGWESVSDRLINTKIARGLVNNHPYAVELLSENPWLKKVDPKTKVFSFSTGFTDETEFKHLTDELHNSLLENTNLPKSLQLRPESLNRMSVAQAVSHVHKINNWRKENMADADRKKANTSAVQLHKDYPNSNFAWYEIKHPELTPSEEAELQNPHLESMDEVSEPLQAKYKILEDALKYEGDVMGHCVGGYADEVASGQSRIFSLRNKKTGEPHVTVETYPKPISDLEQLPSSEKIPMQQAIREWRQRNPQVEDLTDNHVRKALKEASIDLPEDINQIKGKGNDKPAPRYIPFVQDFVKSGKWGDVSDLKNTNLRDLEKTPVLRQWLKGKNIPHNRFVSEDEYNNHEGDFLLDRLNEKAQGGIVRKADGGTIQGTTMPTLAQMRMALMKPNDISSIGAQEAPSMSPKAYFPPDRAGRLPPGGVATPSGMPIGGIDMSRLQGGQQLMPQMQPQQPQNALQPQGGPQPPQGALPEPSPQGPPQGPQGPQSNMLQMTPQGQTMSAIKPQGQQMADGGVVEYPTIDDGVFKNEDDEPGLFRATGMAGGGAFKFRGMRLKPQQRAAMYEEREQDKPSTRVTVQAQGPGGVRGIVVPRHMLEGSLSYNPEDDTEKYVEGMDARNEARAKVYGSENRDPLTIGQIGKIHKETLDSHFQKPISEQIEEEKAALERLRAAKHINKDANTLDESEKLDTVRHEYDEEGRPHVGYASKGIAGHALYTSGTGENERRHVLNVCPGQTSGCGGGVDENGIVDTSKGTCFAPNAESQYVNASVRRACHSQAKADPAMTRDWILAHTGSLRDKARLADKNGERVLFRPNVVDESDTSSRFVTRYLNRQREKEGLPSIIGNSYGKTNELHDPENGWYVTHSNVGPKVKDGRSIAENISRDKQRVRGTILAQEANGSDIKNEDDRPTPPKNSYLVTDVKRESPLDKRMQEAFKYIKYWSAGKPVESLSSAEKDEGSSGHFGPDGKPTSPDKAHYGHITLNGRRYDYQKQHVLHPRLVSVGKNEDGSNHMIPTDSRFMDNAELDKQIPRAKQFKTKSGKRAGLILVTTPTTSTSNEGHETSFTHHVGSAHLDKALKNKGEWEIDSPMEQEAARDKLWAEPKTVSVSAIRKNYAAGGAVSDEFDEYMAFPERSRLAQQHLAHRKEDHFHKHTDHSNTYKMSPISKNLDVMRLEMIRKGK
jgi:hypothetical protein